MEMEERLITCVVYAEMGLRFTVLSYTITISLNLMFRVFIAVPPLRTDKRKEVIKALAKIFAFDFG